MTGIILPRMGSHINPNSYPNPYPNLYPYPYPNPYTIAYFSPKRKSPYNPRKLGLGFRTKGVGPRLDPRLDPRLNPRLNPRLEPRPDRRLLHGSNTALTRLSHCSYTALHTALTRLNPRLEPRPDRWLLDQRQNKVDAHREQHSCHTPD